MLTFCFGRPQLKEKELLSNRSRHNKGQFQHYISVLVLGILYDHEIYMQCRKVLKAKLSATMAALFFVLLHLHIKWRGANINI